MSQHTSPPVPSMPGNFPEDIPCPDSFEVEGLIAQFKDSVDHHERADALKTLSTLTNLSEKAKTIRDDFKIERGIFQVIDEVARSSDPSDFPASFRQFDHDGQLTKIWELHQGIGSKCGEQLSNIVLLIRQRDRSKHWATRPIKGESPFPTAEQFHQFFKHKPIADQSRFERYQRSLTEKEVLMLHNSKPADLATALHYTYASWNTTNFPALMDSDYRYQDDVPPSLTLEGDKDYNDVLQSWWTKRRDIEKMPDGPKKTLALWNQRLTELWHWSCPKNKMHRWVLSQLPDNSRVMDHCSQTLSASSTSKGGFNGGTDTLHSPPEPTAAVSGHLQGHTPEPPSPQELFDGTPWEIVEEPGPSHSA